MTTLTTMESAHVKRRSVWTDRLANFGELACTGDDAFTRRDAWRSFFFRRMGEDFRGRIIFEIGCADATTLVNMATAHPTAGFVGLDWKARQIYLGAERAASIRSKNIALIHGRAQDLDRIFADGELDEILVLQPKPCDRPAELPNRLLGDSFLTAAHRVLRDADSTISLKTDHAGYYQWMIARFGKTAPDWRDAAHARVRQADLVQADSLPRPSAAVMERFDVAVHSDNFWNDPGVQAHTAGRVFAGQTTPFERRFVQKRRPIFYVELRKRGERARTSR